MHINPLLYILLMLKIIKLYKMVNDNSTITYLTEILSKNETIDNHGSIIVTIIFPIFFEFDCLYIYIFRIKFIS